jgi:hypothetical protein
MTYAVNPPKGLGEILESATPPQFIPAQPELFLPVFDKGVNGIMSEQGKPPLSMRKAGDFRLIADVIGHISTFVDTTLLGIAGWSGAPAPPLDARRILNRFFRWSNGTGVDSLVEESP